MATQHNLNPLNPDPNPLKRRRNPNDGDDNGTMPPPPPKKAKGDRLPLRPAVTPCLHCQNHPEGQAAHAITPCNWGHYGSLTLECQNCANYRAKHKNDGNAPHVCQINAGLVGERIYADTDPIAPVVGACDPCVRKGYALTCDVDPILGHTCSVCTNARQKNKQPCTVSGETMGKRPAMKGNLKKWFRHACDTCEAGILMSTTQCSWLADRTSWDKACNSCITKLQLCLDSGNQIAMPPTIDLPTSWRVLDPDPAPYLDTAASTPWREACNTCRNSKIQCKVSAKAPLSACEFCTQLGIDCTNLAGSYAILSLSQVGFGRTKPFQICQECMNNKRNCDHQRPCDSCVKYATDCDDIDTSKKNHAYNDGTYNCIPRLQSDPGILYYLGMGYGPDGVDDPKTGLRLEEWVGPMANVYQTKDAKADAQITYTDAIATRNQCLPWGAPPHGGINGALTTAFPSQMTTQQLVQMIQVAWPGATPPGAAQVTKERAIVNGRPDDGVEHPLNRTTESKQIRRSRQTTARTRRKDPRNKSQTSQPKQAAAPTTAAFSTPTTVAPPASSTSQPSVPALSSAPQPQVDEDDEDNGYGDQSHLFAPLPPAPVINNPWANFNPQTVWGPNVPSNALPAATSSSQAIGANQMPPQPQPVAQAQPAPLLPSQLVNNLLTLGQHLQEEGDEGEEVEEEEGGDGSQDIQMTSNPPHATSQESEQGLGDFLNELEEFFEQEDPSINSGLLQEPEDEEMSGTSDVDGPSSNLSTNMSFNPFLGIDVDDDAPPDFSHPPLLSRWRAANRLEGLDMRHWQRQPTTGRIPPKLFGKVAPSRDAIKDVPLVRDTATINHPALDFCMEPEANQGQGICNNEVTDLTGCQSTAHRVKLPHHFLVCDQCDDASAAVLLNGDDPITVNEIVAMRAYLCTSCAQHVSQAPQNMHHLRAAGAAIVWGKYKDGTAPNGVYQLPKGESIRYRCNKLPATGCACATKIFDRRLCRFHRLYYADQSLHQSALMQEWRLSRFGKAVCPSCILNSTARRANESADQDDFKSGGVTAWACLSCNDWVVNEDNDSDNKPQIVAGLLRAGTLDAQAMFARQGENAFDLGDDEDMLDIE